MATELKGYRLILREYDPSHLLPLPDDPEGAYLDPHVGQVREPTYLGIWLGYELIGDCVMYNPESALNEVEFGIKIAPGYRDKGYGSEAAKILSDYCLSVLGFSRVYLKVLPYNDRAIRSYEKAGFNRCGKIVVDTIEFVKMERRN